MIRIGIDLGGTKIEAAALDGAGAFLTRRRVANPGAYPAALAVLRELVAGVEAEVGPACSVGIGVPGSINPRDGLMRNANATFLNGRPFAIDLSAALGRPVRVANDANCMILSEALDGAATGVSGTGLRRDHAARTGRDLDGEAIVAAARGGDAAAAASLDACIHRLGRALAMVANLVDPDVFVLAGGLSNVAELYPRLPDIIRAHAFGGVWNGRVVPARWGDSSGVRGAARLWAG